MLFVLYDSSLANLDSNLYMKEIAKKIEDVKFLDVSNIKDTPEIIGVITSKAVYPVLFIKPFNRTFKKQMLKEMGNRAIDIEFDKHGLSVTAEAILRVLPEDLKGSRVYIINQSETVGIPLAVALMRKGATVISMGSKSRVRYELFNECPDIIISATGDNNFRLGEKFTERALILVDLSDDLEDKRAIRRIPTVDVLRERLMEIEE